MDPKQQRRPKPPPLENRYGGLLVEPARRSRGSSVAVDAAAIAVVGIARQSIGIVVDLYSRNESRRLRWNRVSLCVVKSAMVQSRVGRRVRGERNKTEA
jgi:hypothetical protein